MSPVDLINIGILRNQPQDREGLSRTRKPGRGHLEHSGGWQDMEGNNKHSAIHFPIQQKPQTRGLEGYGSISSAPPTPHRHYLMEHGQQEVKPSIPLGRTWIKTSGGGATRIRENQATIQAIEEQLTQTGNTQIPSGSQGVGQTSSPEASNYSGTNRSVAKSHHSSQSQVVSRRIQGYKDKNKASFNQRQRELDSMIQKLLAVNTSRISGSINRNITLTQKEHNVVTPESNLNSDEMWLQMSQFAVKTQESLNDLQRINERLQRNAILKEDTIEAIQESCAQLSKASEETKKRLNQVLEEQDYCKRDRECLDHDIKKLFNVCHNNV
ncbi:hypothetical protein O181_018034 [Austropuccinia psidii MF-1]|uniref:Uncharacterized protein n=1 Tax=Austropuccinia psidii MF-1 TaxID=1389203 RepID=A0A9Q3C4I2_9BASI|nr:hypothetical protein [Austropuccinia psidii MF-1]